jgi:hypothetical protein
MAHGARPVCACLLVSLGWLTQGQAAEREQSISVFAEAKDLAPAEMVRLRPLVRPTGKEAWLIYGLRDGFGADSTPSPTQLTVYLKPDRENGGLRRGRVLYLARKCPTGNILAC